MIFFLLVFLTLFIFPNIIIFLYPIPFLNTNIFNILLTAISHRYFLFPLNLYPNIQNNPIGVQKNLYNFKFLYF